MSITILGETREGTGSIRKSGKRLVYEDKYSYIVQTDSKNTSRLAVLSAPGIPRPGLTLSGGGIAVCQSTDATRDAINPKIWHVVANFSSDVQEDTSGANESQSGDPTVWQPIAELSFETFTEIAVKDQAGTAIANSAGQPFGAGIQLTRTLVRYDFEQFEPESTDIDTIAGRNETVNLGTFQGKAAKTLKLTVRSATIGYYYGYKVWRIAYSMVYKPDDWQLKVLDVGNCYLSGGNLEPYLDNQQNRIVGGLNGSGGQVAVGDEPEILTFDKFEAISFSFLRVQ